MALVGLCAAAWAKFFLRSVTPGQNFCICKNRHDEQIWSCFCNLLELSPAKRARVVKDGSNVAVTVRRFGPHVGQALVRIASYNRTR